MRRKSAAIIMGGNKAKILAKKIGNQISGFFAKFFPTKCLAHGSPRDRASALRGRNEKAHCNLRSQHWDLRLQWALTRRSRSSMSRSHVTVRTVRGFDAFFFSTSSNY